MKYVFFKRAIILLGTFITVLTTSITSHAQEKSLPTLKVSVRTLGEISQNKLQSVPANLVSLNNAVISAEIAANVIEIGADIGKMVKKNDLLARLDCRDFDANQLKAEASIAAIKARIEAAKVRIESSKARIKASQSRVKSSEARLKSTETSIQANQVRVNANTARANAAQSRAAATGTQIGTTQARIEAANARCRLANIEFQRTRKLYDQRMIAKQVLDQALSEFQTAQADCKAVASEINTIKANLAAAKSDAAAAQADVNAAQADVLAAKANVGASQADINAEYANIMASEADVQAAIADVGALVGELDSAQAQLVTATLAVDRCVIRAPFTGQIIKRQVQLGQRIGPSEPAFQLLSLKALEVSAQLTARELTDLKAAKALHFSTNNEKIAISLRSVLSEVTGAARTQEARFKPTVEHDLPVGRNGRVEWSSQLPVLPASWLVMREGKLGIMTAQKDSAYFIEMPDAQEGQPIMMDLPSDTLLIDAGRFRVVNGQKIEIIKE